MFTVIIDRNAILRTGLKTILSQNFPNMRILEAESVDSYHGDLHPDLVVFAQQRDSSITAEISQFKKEHKPGTMIVYDMVFDVRVIQECFKIGVAGCISGQTSESEFLKCVREVLDGKRYIGQDFQELIFTEVFSESISVKNNRKRILSPREHEIAVYLSAGHRTSWIARKLERKPSTISTIKKSIFNKLQVNNIADLRNQMMKG